MRNEYLKHWASYRVVKRACTVANSLWVLLSFSGPYSFLANSSPRTIGLVGISRVCMQGRQACLYVLGLNSARDYDS